MHLLNSQSLIIYWVGDSSESEDEREEKWRSILNHIVNIHKHADHKIFKECLHGTLEREWLKQGRVKFNEQRINAKIVHDPPPSDQ